jgi:nickel/cobalt transporter (NicO) family protein
MWLGCPAPSMAHRLDEYLQASRLSVDRDGVTLEIDLTPGVSVAPQVLALLDTNRDGQLSVTEGAAYANQVLNSVSLSIDGKPVVLILTGEQFPQLNEMTLGTGMIRLRANAKIPEVAAGRHQVFYRNSHQPEMSVYLANALVPSDNQIEISGQSRDYAQHELIVDYRVTPKTGWPRSFWLIACLAIAGLASQAMRYRLNHSASHLGARTLT